MGFNHHGAVEKMVVWVNEGEKWCLGSRGFVNCDCGYGLMKVKMMLWTCGFR